MPTMRYAIFTLDSHDIVAIFRSKREAAIAIVELSTDSPSPMMIVKLKMPIIVEELLS